MSSRRLKMLQLALQQPIIVISSSGVPKINNVISVNSTNESANIQENDIGKHCK